MTAATTIVTERRARVLPTRAELAAHLGVTEHDIDIAVNAWTARHPGSLDAFPADSSQAHHALRDTLGGIDARFDTATDLHVLHRLLAMLPTRERRILVMRFAGDMTQAEIATRIGVSQMHVSRLLLRTLTTLRTAMLADQPSPTIPYAVRRS
jgi:RNA polymerase sigma-B factor